MTCSKVITDETTSLEVLQFVVLELLLVGQSLLLIYKVDCVGYRLGAELALSKKNAHKLFAYK